MLNGVNWAAVLAGTAVAFALGMVRFGPLFLPVRAAGSHGITPPERPPLAAMAVRFAGALFSQKSPGAALVDGGHGLAMGVVMIAAQGLL
jgi:hypothetical protein